MCISRTYYFLEYKSHLLCRTVFNVQLILRMQEQAGVNYLPFQTLLLNRTSKGCKEKLYRCTKDILYSPIKNLLKNSV